MARSDATALLTCVRTAARSIDLGQRPDLELLESFLASRDQQAFAALLRRHAPLVLAACRRVLRDEADVEDAFQATFLVLHQKAGSIRKSQSIGGWLFCVARRVALAARRSGARRQVCESRAAPPNGDAPPDLSWDEVRDILHDELERLPEHYRLPILLCYLDGQTREEAARHLDWSNGTLIGRLERGRKMLRRRLLKRGVALSAGLLAILGDSASASVSPALIHTTIRATRGEISPAVAALINGVTPMTIGKSKMLLGLIVIAAALGGFGSLASGGRDTPAKEKPEKPATTPAKAPAQPDVAKERTYKGIVVDQAGKPIAGSLVRHEGKDVAKSDEQGRFAYTTNPAAKSSGPPSPLVAIAEGYGADWEYLGDQTELTMRLVPATTIRGRFIDLEGKPIAGATVRIKQLEAQETSGVESTTGFIWFRRQMSATAAAGLPESVKTDAQGRFAVNGIGAGQMLAVTVEAAGFERLTVRSIADDKFDLKRLAPIGGERYGMPSTVRPQSAYGPTFEHALRPTQPIVGTVRDATSGKPIAGVQIAAFVTNERADELVRASTDAEGRFRLVGLPKVSERSVIFSAGGSSPYLQMGRKVGDIEGLGPITADMTLMRGVRLSGRITDRATGQPLAGASLVYMPLEGNTAVAAMKGMNIERFGAVGYGTDKEGRYSLIVPPGPGVITASMSDRRGSAAVYTQAVLRKEDESRVFKNVDESFGDAFIGQGGRIISLQGQNAYQVIDPPADATEHTCDLQFDAGLTASGKVLDADGKPLRGAQVAGLVATLDHGAKLAGDTFSARALNPARPRTVAFIDAERKLAGSTQLSGEEKDVTVRLQPWSTVTGRFVDADGKPLAGAQVRVVFKDRTVSALMHERWSRTKPLTTDADGRFRFEGIIPGQQFGISVTAQRRRFFDIGKGYRALTLESGQTRDLGDIKAIPREE